MRGFAPTFLYEKVIINPLLIGFISDVNAEIYWLIFSSGAGGTSALEKIEMASMQQCEEQGEIFASERIKFKMNKKQYECLKGK